MKAQREPVEQLLKTTKGQIEGVLRMIDDDRYCIDISNQILACEALLRKANKVVLKGHLEHCVKEAFRSGQNEQEKIDEIMNVLEKMNK